MCATASRDRRASAAVRWFPAARPWPEPPSAAASRVRSYCRAGPRAANIFSSMSAMATRCRPAVTACGPITISICSEPPCCANSEVAGSAGRFFKSASLRGERAGSCRPFFAAGPFRAARLAAPRKQRMAAARVITRAHGTAQAPQHVSGRIHVLETIGYGFDWLRTELAWAPDILTAGVILLLSVALALALYGVIDHFVQPLAGYHPYARTVTSRIRGPMRLAFVVIALFAAVPAAPLDDDAKRLVARILALGVIGLIGWAVMRAIEGAASIYLLRFRLDVEDNL